MEFVPQLSAFAVAAFRLLPSVGKINEHMSATLYSAPSLELIYHDLKEIEDVKKEDKGEEREWKFEKELKVSKLAYHYPDAEENVLDGADFSIQFDLLGRIGNLEDVEDVVARAAQMINNRDVEPNRIAKTVLVIDEAQDMSKERSEERRVGKECRL